MAVHKHNSSHKDGTNPNRTKVKLNVEKKVVVKSIHKPVQVDKRIQRY